MNELVGQVIMSLIREPDVVSTSPFLGNVGSIPHLLNVTTDSCDLIVWMSQRAQKNVCRWIQPISAMQVVRTSKILILRKIRIEVFWKDRGLGKTGQEQQITAMLKISKSEKRETQKFFLE